MTTLCASVQNLGKLMQDGFASESITRLGRDDVRQQAPNEIMEGLENEENAGQLVHRDLEIENLKLGSGSTVCSEESIDCFRHFFATASTGLSV